MKIIVAVKQVPARDSVLRVNADGNWLDDVDLNYEINEPDAYALEEALQLKEKHGGEVVAICAGPDRAVQTLREALAKGADRGIHVKLEDAKVFDPAVTGRLLAKAIESESAELILTGLQSDDLGYGQTGVVLAEILGFPHATIIMEAEVKNGTIRAKRELENGWFQYLELPLPSVLTIQSGIKKLRYATLMGIKKAKSKEVKVIEAGSLGLALQPSAHTKRVYLPEKKKQSQLFTGDPKQAAVHLVEKLRFEARIL
jgi:electron transfer flavoprotein beta subunit